MTEQQYWTCPKCKGHTFGTAPLDDNATAAESSGARKIVCHGDLCTFAIPQAEWERQHPHPHNAGELRETETGRVVRTS